jgi:hypothetical protein
MGILASIEPLYSISGFWVGRRRTRRLRVQRRAHRLKFSVGRAG